MFSGLHVKIIAGISFLSRKRSKRSLTGEDFQLEKYSLDYGLLSEKSEWW